ncbi:hypothetical protein AVEN_174995-1 [Araneus ventricosus]|uniref:Uncharacterized protein n=1 Tax=Araneus ventricosus TaxID=182803 RepID=A0A4Y2KJR9_ARAVE|nr:hypothetical protein AVEN_174995-1 [Araneus ventricosus]
MAGVEVIGDPFQPFLFEVWHWLLHMPRHCENTLRSIVKCRANSTTTAIIAVRQVKPFEVGRERAMLREEDNILSNPISGTENKLGRKFDADLQFWCKKFIHHSDLVLISSLVIAHTYARLEDSQPVERSGQIFD